jgi:hypothetical protein
MMETSEKPKPCYWLLRIPPLAVVKLLFREDGIYFWKARLKGKVVDPETQVIRVGYDMETDAILMVLQGNNGYLVPEGSTIPTVAPEITLVNLDYEELEQLPELFADPDCGKGVEAWVRQVTEDMKALVGKPL